MEIETQTSLSNSIENTETTFLLNQVRQQMNTFIQQISNENIESQSTDRISISEDEQQNLLNKKKDVSVKLRKKQKRVCQTFTIPLKFKGQDVFHVFGDFCISGSYQVRLGGSLGWTQLGFDNLVTESIQKYDDFIDTKLRFNRIQEMPLEKAVIELQNVPHQTYYQLSQVLLKIGKYYDQMKAEMLEYNEVNQERYDYEYNQYSQFCLEKVKELMKQYNLSSYCIGRTNFKDGSLDVSHVGYSNGLLDLICLDYNTMQQLCLRDRQIQLVKDINQILESSLFCLMSRFQNSTEYKIRVNFTTLDGYDLWLDLTYHKIQPPTYKGMFGNFFFCLIEIDIDANQLKGLLDYRNSIQSKNANFNSFLQNELSFFQEDIEYSILSQSFLEKYYQDLIKKIQGLHSQSNDQLSKQCGFRLIS
ncbi:hypothetical protein TTHERM_00629730 (macronuclear) [Tetrahymena thermophila SB210]|uniref:Uncharacterized protein n=1 Tax=Tetrahymena thermophila (strain SB210) TaxID=312017 RepID=Q241V3_TETTS|nr:hypothetical protein TTHERM_00629730 [Tetrahymena thermophila SB210]EAS02467.2 hypothetical protein TTHERM_00629730 [Tetrahymena thermophila SB210]|eukprot:XP_001022712.2 hypothetical protein TTHERM_00629730 [Tetrahymena thermophila SB210]